MPEMKAHPSPEQLSAYNLGQLPPDEVSTIESHINQCDPCCDTIIGLASDDTFVGLLKEARQLPTDQTMEYGSGTSSSTCQEVPAQLAEHPRYEVLGLIGKGGMGDVYKARHRKMEREVALKVINRGLFQKTEVVDRFHREVKAAAQLSHPNIVTAYDADQADEFHFMVMEYVDGVDLARTIKDRGALSVAEACDYIRQAAIGLQHAHQRGMVHRDIKPHNLMVTRDGIVKILDFGLASLAPESALDSDAVEARGDLTAAGAIMGTPDFISPEQATDARQADIRSDIYSLGATLYFLLSGRAPFSEGSVTQKLKSHSHAEPEPLESLRDDVPPELLTIVSKMTAKDPGERFQTPVGVADALESLGKRSQPVAASKPQLFVQDSRQRNRWISLTAIATIFFAAIFLGMVYYMQTNNGTIAQGIERFLKGTEDYVSGMGKVVAFVPQEGVDLSMIDPDTSDRAVELRIWGDEATLVQRGDRVRLEFEGWPAVEPPYFFGGKVVSLDPTANGAGKFRVLIKGDDKDSWPDKRYLRPGVRANCWISTVAQIPAQQSEARPPQPKIEKEAQQPLGENQPTQPFSYDLSLVPANAQLVIGARSGNILRDPKLAKLRESAPPLAGFTSLFVNESIAQVLAITLPKPNRISNPRVIILTVDKGDAMEEVDRAVGILKSNPDDYSNPDEAETEYESTGYVKREGRLLVRRIDRNTVILGTREELDAHKLAMSDPLPNELREVAGAMQDCEIFVIANTQDKSYFAGELANSGIGPVDDLLPKVRFIYGGSKFVTASVSLGETPRLQVSVRAEAQERNHEVAMAVTELRDQTMTLIRENLSLLADGTFFKDKESAAAATASLLLSQVTEPTPQDTLLDIPLMPAMSTLVKMIGEQFDANKIQRTRVRLSLNRISLGFMRFHEQHGYLPSVSTKMPGSALPVSWRVAILPYVGQEELYAQYKLDEAWDSEHNKTLLAKMPEIYRHLSSWRQSTETNVVAFVGGDTAVGTGDEPVRLDGDLKDDRGLTILVAESAAGIPWTQPKDIPFSEGEPLPPIDGPGADGWHAVFADGSVQFVPWGTSADVLAAMLTRNGGEAVHVEDGTFSLREPDEQPQDEQPRE